MRISMPDNFTGDDIIKANPELQMGGTWKPANCTARHRVAVVVPYRDRERHLLTMLAHLHPILQRQQLDYTAIVVEQVESKLLIPKLIIKFRPFTDIACFTAYQKHPMIGIYRILYLRASLF